MDKKNVNWKLIPPQIHRRNAAERETRTFKNHFMAGLASTNNNFQINLWDRLLPQVITTLNLLRNYRINPRLLAEAQLNGMFNYESTFMAPTGIKVIIHEKPQKCGSWIPQGAKVWYVGHAPHHYCCWKIYVTKMAAKCIGNIVELFLTNENSPMLSTPVTANKVALELMEFLKNPSPSAPFFRPIT